MVTPGTASAVALLVCVHVLASGTNYLALVSLHAQCL